MGRSQPSTTTGIQTCCSRRSRPSFRVSLTKNSVVRLTTQWGPSSRPQPFTRKDGRVQISPADERCSVGELTIRQDSTRRWPELSGELFTIRPVDSAEQQ